MQSVTPLPETADAASSSGRERSTGPFSFALRPSRGGWNKDRPNDRTRHRTAPQKTLAAFIVSRMLPFAKRHMVGPFIFFDHMGPVDLPKGIPRSVDVRPHPHIGLSTVTYLFDGGDHASRLSWLAGRPLSAGEVKLDDGGDAASPIPSAFEKARGARRYSARHPSLGRAPETRRKRWSRASPIMALDDLPTYGEAAGLWARLIAGRGPFGAKAKVKDAFAAVLCALASCPAGATAQMQAEYSERAAYYRVRRR